MTDISIGVEIAAGAQAANIKMTNKTVISVFDFMFILVSLLEGKRLTVCVIRMSLFGTWLPRILEGDSSPGTRGRERLGCPAAGMGTFSP